MSTQDAIQLVQQIKLQDPELANLPINVATTVGITHVDPPSVPSPTMPSPAYIPQIATQNAPQSVQVTRKTLPSPKDNVEIPVATFQMVKVSSGGSRMSRLVRLDPITGRLMVETREISDAPMEDGHRWRPIEFERIFEVRKGVTTKDFALGARDHERDRAFSILYLESGKRTEVNLIAGSTELRDKIVAGIEYMIAGGSSISQHDVVETMIRRAFEYTDGNGDGKLSFKEVGKLKELMQMRLSNQELAKAFKHADANNSGYLGYEEFKIAFVTMLTRIDLFKVFDEAVANPVGGLEPDKMNFEEFKQFCRVTQRQPNISEQYLREQFERFSWGKGLMTKIQFTHFLQSGNCSAARYPARMTWQNMNRPLNEYFISTSHNTYLLADQLKGEGSVEAYIRYLQSGCRVVELDTWEQDGEPIVYHGYTATTRTLYKDIITAIKKYAFVTTPFPVILDHELHVSPAVNAKMAKYLKEILGDQLVTQPLGPNETHLPSPNQLKYRFLVKDGGAVRRLDQKAPQGLTDAEVLERAIKAGTPEAIVTEGNPMHPDFARLVIYTQDIRFKNMAPDLSNKAPNHIFEISEGVATSLLPDWSKWAGLATTQLCRVYPAGGRILSSNFVPQPFWDMGFQVCAQNWQTFDTGMQLERAMFRSNGLCGYVLKPQWLRIPGADGMMIAPKTTYRITLKILSGFMLPRPYGARSGPIVSPYVCVELFGYNAKLLTKSANHRDGGEDFGPDEGQVKDEEGPANPKLDNVPRKSAMYQTKVVDGCGLRPSWDEEIVFTTERLETAFIRLYIKTARRFKSDQAIGVSTYSLANLAQGYRNFNVWNWKGFMTYSTLFCRVYIDQI